MLVKVEELALKVGEIRQHAQYCSEMCCDEEIAKFILDNYVKKSDVQEALRGLRRADDRLQMLFIDTSRTNLA